MREAFAMQKLLIFFPQKYWQISHISFEQPGPDILAFTIAELDADVAKSVNHNRKMLIKRQY